MRAYFILLTAIGLSACTTPEPSNVYDEMLTQSSYFSTPDTSTERRPSIFENFTQSSKNPTRLAVSFLNFGERTHRQELKEFTGVDPVRTEWCAAFVNAVLRESGIPGSESVSRHPLLARSFLKWGDSVDTPKSGDLIVFPRGNASWQGHVGFYMGTVEVGGVEYYRILGGNQNNEVSIELYPVSRAIDIRRESRI